MAQAGPFGSEWLSAGGEGAWARPGARWPGGRRAGVALAGNCSSGRAQAPPPSPRPGLPHNQPAETVPPARLRAQSLLLANFPSGDLFCFAVFRFSMDVRLQSFFICGPLLSLHDFLKSRLYLSKAVSDAQPHSGPGRDPHPPANHSTVITLFSMS